MLSIPTEFDNHDWPQTHTNPKPNTHYVSFSWAFFSVCTDTKWIVMMKRSERYWRQLEPHTYIMLYRKKPYIFQWQDTYTSTDITAQFHMQYSCKSTLCTRRLIWLADNFTPSLAQIVA